MRILGIDPGLATIGFGIIDVNGPITKVIDFGHIQTPKSLSNASRLNQIHSDLNEICQTWQPDVCAIEELYFSKNTTTALKVAEARGVILHTVNRLGYPIFEYNPGQIKVAITGNGKAAKVEMQKMVALILKLKSIPRPDDAADALAIALCHAQTKF
jgi:crossover junction endodeoxyribonuclease RuvC